MLPDVFRFQDFELDRSAYELRRDGQSVRLERIPFELLCLMVERHGELVAREEIIARIWGKDVFHDTEHGINTAVRKIRQALHDDPDKPRFVVTVPAKGYRFVAAVEKLESVAVAAPAPAAPAAAMDLGKQPVTETPSLRSRLRLLIPAAAFFVALAVAAFFHFHRVQALSEKDTIVIADFANSTGDSVFDDTLKQALSVELSQSPFLNILSDEQMSGTLQMMGHPADERVNEKTAVEVCKRTQSAAVLAGSIAALGREYVIGLNAVICRTGELLAQEQMRATSKEDVLKAVDRAATKVRARLGESLSTIKKFDVPIEQATTPSLEALRTYSLGLKNLRGGNFVAAVPAFQNSIALDPNFAMAHAVLATTYSNLRAGDLAAEHARKAYELRAPVSERERFYIESHYHIHVTGNLEKQREAFELWAQVYPRDSVPPFNLGDMYSNLGQYEKALEEARESLRLDPGSAIDYSFLSYIYLTLNRMAEARATADEALAKKFDSPSLHLTGYLIAFAQDDSAGMAGEFAWSSGKSGMEDIFLNCAADAAAYSGKLTAAREFSRRAILSALQANKTEEASNYRAQSALREAIFGNTAKARQETSTAVANPIYRSARFVTTLALAMAGDTARAQSALTDLASRFPEDTIVQFIYLPTIRAQIALDRSNPASAVESLASAAPYELSDEGALYPVYLLGQAYLALRRGDKAALEFQKILDHRGIVLIRPIGALAHLGLGRAYALQGDTTKARAAYQNFVTLWKDADLDVPVLKQAKTEYAKLQ